MTVWKVLSQGAPKEVFSGEFIGNSLTLRRVFDSLAKRGK